MMAQPTRPEIQKNRKQIIFCVGSNHRTAAIGTRESFYLSPPEIQTAIKDTSSRFKLNELAIISTCNRCEIFGVMEQHDKNTSEFLYNLYRQIHSKNSNQLVFDPSALSKSLYVLTGLDAVRHAFQVASSLDSMVPGETQITGQFKDAMNIAKDAGTLGVYLNRLTQEALATAKKIRTNTDIGRHKVSIAHAAIDLAQRASDDLSKLRFLIVGAGEMARVAAEYAHSYKPRQLIIANRTSSKAFALTERLGFGDAQGLDNLSSHIGRSDVIICATSSSDFLITRDHIVRAMKTRGSNPLFLIDIALPRNIAPDTSTLDDVYLFDIDDLKSVVEAHLDKRREALAAASIIVQESVENFSHWISSQDLSPTLSATANYYAEICRREGEKTLNKELFSNLTEKQRESIISMLESISAKLTSDVAHTLKQTSEDESLHLASLLDLIFKRPLTK